MKPGITAKLFMAIFFTCGLVLITMNWGVRMSFEHGFIDYIRQSNEQRMELLADTLQEQYKQHGSWEFLQKNDKLIYQIMRSFEQNSASSQMLPPQGWRTKFWILDSHNQRIGGSEAPIPADLRGLRRIMIVDGMNIGTVLSTPAERLTRNADINFDRQQNRTSWIIVGFTTLLAAAVTWLLSRGMLAPVKRLVQGTHQLAAGNFSSRVKVDSQDELGKLAQDFNQLAMTLEKNEQMRRAFMADISHELRTPLAVLRGELEAMQDGVRKMTLDSLGSLQSEVSILTKLVDDLHQLSLSDAGALAYRKEEIDAVHLIQLAEAGYRDRFRQKQLTLSSSLPEKVMLFGDPQRLSQLFNNLLENSLRYTDGGGGLEIIANKQDKSLRIIFQDTAPGINDEQLQHIFERFYRAEGSRNRASGGSGLGLAICQNIVEAHSGRINASKSPSGGICMTINLPLSIQLGPRN
ncbi:envelope stress sensor histidine kinase BaeS [Hafnia psychrotolerans]|jgi:two-component system sensor histidine kinase BaeS|uniref:histidine kinase n=1 Tax=Hafnia psychrotolerans TaxID=1477018 RepID=A0ABQ1H0V5_9GAMM|nr:two-component system sensor histidine kinase BaeS [Hafnia psychrotolerans]GGA54992.1 two-component sensor histidine kinase [Hafnia psychrotolerans]